MTDVHRTRTQAAAAYKQMYSATAWRDHRFSSLIGADNLKTRRCYRVVPERQARGPRVPVTSLFLREPRSRWPALTPGMTPGAFLSEGDGCETGRGLTLARAQLDFGSRINELP